MIPIPPRSKRTDTLFPTTTLSRPLQDGLSARELAIDTTRFGSEKFPMFRAVWLQQPRKDDDSVTVLALLDSASTAGAYRFVIHPGRTTVIDVDTRSEEHTSELQSLMRISYAVFCLKKTQT